MLDLYSIGEMVIDFIPGTEPGSYVRNAGGAPANVAIAMARNGLKAGMCCSVGEDDFGRFLIKTLEENQVRCIKPKLCEEAITTMAFVSLAENGERTFTFAGGGCEGRRYKGILYHSCRILLPVRVSGLGGNCAGHEAGA